MTANEQFREEKEKEFLEILCELQEFLKQNPNHIGTLAKDKSKISRRLYTLYEIRTGKISHSVFTEQHFSVLDNILPGWDNYTMSKFNFEEFYKELEKYTKEKNDFYDKLQVPEVLRDLHVPENQKNGTYPLGRKFYRLRSGLTTLTKEQLDMINSINPHCLKEIPTYDLAGFYVALKKYVEEKDKEYDKLDIPMELRDYSVSREAVVGDYKIGVRFKTFKKVWTRLTREQQNCFLEIAPSLFEHNKNTSFDFGKFFAQYATFIKNKNIYYDKLETPNNLRSYSIHKNETIFGVPLGEKLYYVQHKYDLSPKQEDALNNLNPQWRNKPIEFDFGKFYGHLLQFKKQRDAHYNKMKVPVEQRKYTIFSSSFVNSYPLGSKMYLIKTKKIKISDLEKEYLLKFDPNCLTAPITAPTKLQAKKAATEKEQI